MKNSLYPFKWPLVSFLLGSFIRMVGAMMKILHWVHADLFLFIGTIIMLASIVWLIIKLVFLKEQNN